MNHSYFLVLFQCSGMVQRSKEMESGKIYNFGTKFLLKNWLALNFNQ